jgi:hypothetical protein
VPHARFARFARLPYSLSWFVKGPRRPCRPRGSMAPSWLLLGLVIWKFACPRARSSARRGRWWRYLYFVGAPIASGALVSPVQSAAPSAPRAVAFMARATKLLSRGEARSSAMPPISSPEVLAARFNVLDHDAMRATCAAMGGVKGLAPVATRDYSGGLAAQALFRAPPVKHICRARCGGRTSVISTRRTFTVIATHVSSRRSTRHTPLNTIARASHRSAWCRNWSSWSAGLPCISLDLVWA